jgi:hypothetical protein
MPAALTLPWLTTAFFSLTLPPALYILYAHRRGSLLGWLMVFNFCILRVISNVMQIKAADGATYSAVGVQVVESVGMATLLPAGVGILHEA